MAVIRAFAFVFISSEVVLYIYLWQTVLGWPSWRILKLFSIIACWSFSMCHYKMSGFHNSYPIKFHYCCHFICGNSYQWVFVFFLHPWMSNYIKLFFYSLQAVSYFLHLKRILFCAFHNVTTTYNSKQNQLLLSLLHLFREAYYSVQFPRQQLQAAEMEM